MNALAVPMQMIPEFGVPGIVSTLILIVVVILVARVVLSIALKVAVVAALVAGVLWFFGLLRLIPFL
jgi:hypothetical protein